MMKQLKIDNISLSDFGIKEMSLGENYDEINIVSDGSIRISDLERYNETRITIKKWEKLCVSKYITKDPSTDGYYVKIDWMNSMETFDCIQEILLNEETTLVLNGFSKESDGWLTYKFFEFEYEITIASK
ncbi:hypothetical protein [uncultured Aquimarina sp.]|uniref:hypothetical protein n=1 Tax=uncultured Aquimarina sp. TaxID=575652 RepID=UPI00261E6EBC|nr:hypothetical protein [uncultured Aquimarina sp.]